MLIELTPSCSSGPTRLRPTAGANRRGHVVETLRVRKGQGWLPSKDRLGSETPQTASAAGRQECCPGQGQNRAKNGRSACLRRKAIMLRRSNRLNQYDDTWKPAAKKIPIVIARTICVTMILNAQLLASLNAIYKIDYLFDPSTAGTMETCSVAQIVVFAIARGETVPFCRCISMPNIYMQPTFD